MRYFVHYWRSKTFNYMRHEYSGVEHKHTASELFRKRGVKEGDILYGWSFSAGALFLIGRMQVGKYISQKQADALYRPSGDSAWKAADHVLAERSTATPMCFDLTIPFHLLRKLEFVSPTGRTKAKFVGRRLDPQTCRGLREVTTETALLLDKLIGSHATTATANTAVGSSRHEPKGHNALEDLAAIYANPHYGPTEKKRLCDARLGQGVFRKKLERLWGGCAVNGVKALPLLRASHIKPWSKSSDDERLDPYNGLLLLPNLDLALDGGYISFRDNGQIMISSYLDRATCTKMGIHAHLRLRMVKSMHRPYLSYHRRKRFKQ